MNVFRRRFSTVFNIGGDLVSRSAEVGSFAQISHAFTQEEVTKFSGICGDNNPLHIDPKFAEGTHFKGTIVHGILVSSLFSTLFGRSISGAIYVSQSLNFKAPVHVGAAVVARVEVLSRQTKRKGELITCSSIVRLEKCGTLVVDGEAKVLIPFAEKKV